jgi:hypothetical protein
LQVRQNFQFVSSATLDLNPELNEYARITQGYRRDDSPDAWAYLREMDFRGRPVKNIERWLVQRYAPGSRSVPAERIDRFPLPWEKRRDANETHDFDARRTDIANGESGLLFSLDPVFWSEAGPATVKVTYTDRAAARWRLHYADAGGKVKQTPPVENTGDGKRKTATFRLPGLSAAGVFPNDPAFLAWRDRPVMKPGNAVANPDFREGRSSWSNTAEYEIVADPDRPNSKMVEFTFRPGKDDTVHLDQIVPLESGETYRLTASIQNDGKNLKPGVRIGGMNWSTIAYVSSPGKSEWETHSATFTAPAEETVRLQLFGQGRGHMVGGQSGKARFKDLRIEPVPNAELARNMKFDFRLVTEGPGDLTVTMVRVIKEHF